MPGRHASTVTRFIERLHRAVSRSALLRIAMRRSGGSMLDISAFDGLGDGTADRVLAAFIGPLPEPADREDGGPDSRSRGRGGSRTNADDDDEDRPGTPRPRVARVDLAAPDAAGLFDGAGEDESDAAGAGRRSTVGPRLERHLKSILRRAGLARRETGVHALWFGWPLLKVSSTEGDNAQTVLAPLFLFPAEVTPSDRRRSLVHIGRHDEAGEPRWNSVLQEWLDKKLGITLEAPPNDLGDWRATEFLAWIEKTVAAFRPAPDLDLAGGMVPVPTRLSDAGPSTTAELLHAGALGLYRWQNAAVLRDLETICGEARCPEPLEGFLEGRPRPQPSADEPEEFDRHLVTDADYSQARVVWASREAEGLVMHGPPGTGKSQTIVNVIADALSRGERVLMVSQKDAATRVVHNRLKQAGLGELCLEVHDAEADRLSVFRAIRTQVDELPDKAPAQPGQRRILAEEIEALEGELDAFAVAMRVADEEIGVAYGEVQALRGQASERFPEVRPLEELPPEIASIDREGLTRLETRLRELGRLFREAGLPDNPWRGRVKDVEHRVGFQQDLATALDLLRARSRELDEAVEAIRAATPTQSVGRIAGDPDTWRRRIDGCLEIATEIAADSEEMRREIVAWLGILRSAADEDVSTGSGAGPAAAETALAAAAEAVEAVRRSDEHPADPAWRAALEQASNERVQTVLAACAAVDRGLKRSWFARLFDGGFRKARRVLAAVRQDATGDLLADVAASGVRHGEALRHEQAVRRAAAGCHPVHERSFDDVESAKAWIRLVHDAGERARRARDLLDAAPPLQDMIERACAGSPPEVGDESLRQALRLRGERLSAVLEALGSLSAFFKSTELERRAAACRGGGSLESWIDAVEANRPRLVSLAAWDAELESLDSPTRLVVHGCYDATRDHARSNESPTTFGERWATIATVSVASRWDAFLRRTHPVLGRVTATGHVERVERLRQKLAKKRALESKAILATWGRRQQERRGYQWKAVFKLRGGTRGPSLRLREAISQSAEEGLFDMRPCWLTNPAAVSEIFPLRPDLFDLVVFDEASQCPLEQSIPTIYRGTRVLIAGDQKQLPPTSFFSSAGDEEEFGDGSGAGDDEDAEKGAGGDGDTSDEAVVVERARSRIGREHVATSGDLLEAAVGTLPETYLQVHYRSRHPELIQYSNHAFYEGRLEAPPLAAGDGGEPPIVLAHREDVYRDRTNRDEALRVVDTLAELIAAPTPPTIGVVTFNKPQRDLIEDLLDERSAESPEFAERLGRARAREDDGLDVGLFVKNLENVQGDERDVMVFSTTFGRDGAGRFRRFFGPVGQVGGERRLNVAVTRAKRRVIVVSSMPVREVSEALGDLGGDGGLKPRDFLQLYLEYARAVEHEDHGQVRRLLDRLSRRGGVATGGGPDSPFEVEVLEALERMGVDAHPQIGDGGFRIDIGIPHRERTRGYALGIECDGAAYHSDRSARIRDVWRQEILESRGWRIHRIWSRSWWDDRPGELNRLEKAVRTALEG
ncbi:MAG: AAA domain-containing protein [Planctomycetota bacterium]|jgi:hypothetical protein